MFVCCWKQAEGGWNGCVEGCECTLVLELKPATTEAEITTTKPFRHPPSIFFFWRNLKNLWIRFVTVNIHQY
jgi:hypothetical protein